MLSTPAPQSSDRQPYIVRPETEQFLTCLDQAIAASESSNDLCLRVFHVWGVGG